MLILFTTIPYFIGFQVEEECAFSGFVFGVEDGNSYIAKMRRGLNGDWLFRTPYTSIEQPGVLAFIPYIFLGKLAGGSESHAQLVVLYQLFRWGSIIGYVYALYRFLGLFTEDDFWKAVGVVLGTVGAGLGWALILAGRSELLGSIPLDFYSPETFGFLSILGLPHLVASRAFLLLGMVAFLKANDDDRRPLNPGLLILLAGIFQPLSMVIGLMIIGAYCFVMMLLRVVGYLELDFRRLIKLGLLTATVPAPYIIYLLISFAVDPFLSEWTAQNVIRSPHPVHYLLAYAVLLLPVAYGIWLVIRRRDHKGFLPLVWVILLPILAYAPHNLQRRLPEGVWIAMISLVTITFSSLSEKEKRVNWAAIPIILLGIPSSLLLLIGAGTTAATVRPPVFQAQEQIAAFQWLDQHLERDAVLLAAYETANPLPAWAFVRTPAGHGPESINLAEILPEISRFYRLQAGMSDQDRAAFLRSLKVDFVFHGPNERELGAWDPSKVDFLTQVFRQKNYSIYRVDDVFLSPDS
jgi:hypothetical protein